MGTENYDTTWSHHFGSFSVYENRPFAFSEKCSNLQKISESSALLNDARSSSLLFEYNSGVGAGTRRVELFNSDTNIWDSSSDWTYNINSDWYV